MTGADVLVFCVPHQFAHSVCKELRAVATPGAIAISLTKVPTNCDLFGGKRHKQKTGRVRLILIPDTECLKERKCISWHWPAATRQVSLA